MKKIKIIDCFDIFDLNMSVKVKESKTFFCANVNLQAIHKKNMAITSKTEELKENYEKCK